MDDIVAQVRDKGVSLERSLDLFDEAIALGSKAVSLVDATDFSPEEEARLAEAPSEPAGQAAVPDQSGEKDGDAAGAADEPADERTDAEPAADAPAPADGR
nr:exodeoxyribonuclease VII small subunit [Olsenella profusa]